MAASRRRWGSVRRGVSPTELLFEDAVLFPQVGDHLKLVTIHPPGEGHEEEPPSDRVKHLPSLPVAAGT